MKSLPVVGLALVAVLGLAAWFAYGSGEDETPIPSATRTTDTETGRKEAPRAAAERSEVPSLPHAAQSAAPPDASPPTEPPPEATTHPANVRLFVSSATTKQPLASFRWRIRGHGPTAELGTGTDGHADFTLPADLVVELLVEADGYSPFTATQLTTPAADGLPLDVNVFLETAAVATGISLHVHDVSLQPIPNVRVEAFAVRPEDRDLAWYILGKPLWVRRSADADGHYVLPELAAGEYGIRVLATDPDGNLLPLLPFRRIYQLTGSNGFVEDVTLEPGCLPMLLLVDPAGQPLDPQHGIISLGLRLPGGPMIARHWVQKRETGVVRAVDALPGLGVTWPSEPVAAGTWQLDVQIDGQPALQQRLELRAGERQEERIYVPR
jgi:hypothetical protein